MTTLYNSSQRDVSELPALSIHPLLRCDSRSNWREHVRNLVNSRELAWRLFVRDTSAQYRQSVLGYLWVFIPPLEQVCRLYI